ncbi:sensor histidine kinase [Companilactobacillus kimchiensis]|uniref:histidine kinase n=1 Tax=Companilactobacillus kimchiensis TaxID=993692 RepID=A0A0R2L389_9LACO|nr:sensor histidine kinase [Companilactobacillus kimchiensis]KRN96078.1 sensory transduction protein kinase [Companilactobacillus kimchiensis]
MKNFLNKQVLFPKRMGFMPYFWTFALILMAAQLLFTHPLVWWQIILFLIFLKVYRDGYVINRFIWADIGIQLLIGTLFTIIYPDGGGTFFIFTAWNIGSLPFKQKSFLKAYVLYLVFSMTTILCCVLMTPLINKYNVFGIIITLTFAIGSPLAARSVSNTYRRTYQTKQNNRRLESIIKHNERDRIAKDLHDNLGQSFSLITLKSELADKLIDRDPQKAHQQLKDIAQTSRENLSLVRKIVADLNGKTIASAMIEEEKNLELAKIQQISINEESSTIWPQNIQHVLAAVIKEATTNVIRYSQANTVKFTFEEDTTDYLLEIQDDGIGLKKHSNRVSFGLSGMTTRLQDINGKIAINSNHGVNLQISVPKGR